MVYKKRILIIGPIGEVGGVKTHVGNLKRILEPYASHIKVTREAPVLQMVKERLFYQPELVIYNLSVYQNKVLRDILTRTIFSSKRTLQVVHLHGGKFSDINYSKYYLWKKFLKFHFNRFKRIFCLTDEQYSYVLSSLNGSLKVKKIFNYVDLPHIDQLKKEDENINLLYVGRLHPLKGVMTAIKAVRKIKDKRVRFWIVGAGELENEIKRIDDPRIIFLGKKVGPEKDAILSKAHIFLFPTSWPEGMPYSLLEASSFGLALISTHVGSIDQILFDGRNGYFVDANNISAVQKTIEKLIADRSLVHRMGRESRKICEEHFSLTKLQQIYDDLFKEYREEYALN